ncbi:translation elongation factor Ts [candidate division LCP-89 bacterium B3_LCP]|uniref:Elongation factor Ts n=1 Tax=candidate division LCP-89 bacterium B3_LCP TaxID=2012998 RepID=A0A532UXW7_UNCL8|nr:MAG: translation elongation factor Ts [candidate division LCP-89 bacterium B3_LCP]
MTITSEAVKTLRVKTGAGMMDCKKALVEAEGSEEKAIEFLRKRGLAHVAKRSGREAKEGLIDAYIHIGSKLGVMVELNCETDFVANTDEFKELARNISLHVAASNPLAISREEIQPDLIEKEKEIYKGQIEESGKKKPPDILEKILTGKLEKFYTENCLLEQAYVKDTEKTIGDLVTEAAAKLGENIMLRRFSRLKVGE